MPFDAFCQVGLIEDGEWNGKKQSLEADAKQCRVNHAPWEAKDSGGGREGASSGNPNGSSWYHLTFLTAEVGIGSPVRH